MFFRPEAWPQEIEQGGTMKRSSRKTQTTNNFLNGPEKISGQKRSKQS